MKAGWRGSAVFVGLCLVVAGCSDSDAADGSALSSLVDEIESTIRATAEFEAADKSSVSTIDSDYELHSATVLRLEEWTAVVRAYVMLHPDDIEKLILQARVTYAYTYMSMVEAELARIRGGSTREPEWPSSRNLWTMPWNWTTASRRSITGKRDSIQ